MEEELEEITLAQWLKEKRNRLLQFEAFWTGLRAVRPEQYPDRLLSSEWDEQFRAFEEQSQ
jgi:hypothetical protein